VPVKCVGLGQAKHATPGYRTRTKPRLSRSRAQRAGCGSAAFILSGDDTKYVAREEEGVSCRPPDREDVMHGLAFTIERIAVPRALPLE